MFKFTFPESSSVSHVVSVNSLFYLEGNLNISRPQSSFTVSVVEVPKLVGSCWSSKWLEGSWNHSNFGGQTFYIAKYQESHVMNRSKH